MIPAKRRVSDKSDPRIEKGYQVLKQKKLSRNSQAKSRRVKPPRHTVLSGADCGLNDEGPEDLTTGVKSTQ
jgi:hypothetical protein